MKWFEMIENGIKNEFVIPGFDLSKYRNLKNYNLLNLIRFKNSLRSVGMTCLILVISFVLLLSSTNAQDQNLLNKFRLAQSYEQANQLEKAKELYTEIYNLQPNNNQFVEALNRVYVRLKEYDNSISLLTTSINRNPQDVSKFGMLGSTYYLMDNSQKAFDTWEEGLKAIPNSVVTYRVIANYAIENRAFDKAIEILQEGKEINNDPRIFSYDLANLYSITMNFEGAVKEYADLLDQDPNQLAVIKNRMAQYLNRPGAVSQTAEALESIIENNPKSILYDLLSYTYIQGSDYKNALEVLIEADKKYIKNGSAVFNLAEASLNDNQIEISVKAFNYVLENYPNSPFALAAKIGFAKAEEARLENTLINNNSWKPYSVNNYTNKDSYQKIVRIYESFIESESVRNPYYFEALYRIAFIEKHKLNNIEKADSLFSLITERAPVSEYGSNSYLELGDSFILKNELEIAEELLQKGLNLYRITPNQQNLFRYKLAKVYFWKGEFDNSLKHLAEITKDLKDNTANDALQLSFIINIGKKDSVSLVKYAEADHFAEQGKFNLAADNFRLLSQNENLLILNDISKLKYAEMLAALDYFPETVKILEEIVNLKTRNIFSDKSLYFLGEVYEFGLKDLNSAKSIYQKLLENYPNSIYFESCREKLNDLTTNKSNT